MKKKVFYLFIVLMQNVYLTGCNTVSEKSKTITILGDYSAYLNNLSKDNFATNIVNIYTNNDTSEDEAVLGRDYFFISSETISNSTVTYVVDVSNDTSDVYFHLPLFVTSERIDTQFLAISNNTVQENEYLKVKSISIHDSDEEDYTYKMEIQSYPSSTLPETLTYEILDRKVTSTGQYTQTNDLDEVTITYEFYLKEIDGDLSSNYDSLLNSGNISFDVVKHYKTPVKAVFTSDDVEIHIIG